MQRARRRAASIAAVLLAIGVAWIVLISGRGGDSVLLSSSAASTDGSAIYGCLTSGGTLEHVTVGTVPSCPASDQGVHWWGGAGPAPSAPAASSASPALTPTAPAPTTPPPTPTTPTPVPPGTHAWTSTGQFATYTADGFKWNNDAWGSGAGSQTIEVNGPGDWSVVSNQAYQQYQVQTYPDIFVNPNEPVSYYSAITSTASEQSPSGPGEHNEAAYNIWLNGTPGTNAGGDGSTSVMIWTDCHGVSVSNEGTYTIGGTRYYFNKSLVQPGNFYQWTFVQLTNTSTQTTNILAVLDWIAAHCGPSSPTLTAIDFGWEIWGTEGTQKFHVSDYSLTMTP